MRVLLRFMAYLAIRNMPCKHVMHTMCAKQCSHSSGSTVAVYEAVGGHLLLLIRLCDVYSNGLSGSKTTVQHVLDDLLRLEDIILGIIR